mmetsp:Transcript_55802/g.129969  ORF Transcript_55802/g.129969 Transcript_55802/m.129969 type:complete len:206 (-) Transcript_55802:426-1043(-)
MCLSKVSSSSEPQSKLMVANSLNSRLPSPSMSAMSKRSSAPEAPFEYCFSAVMNSSRETLPVLLVLKTSKTPRSSSTCWACSLHITQFNRIWQALCCCTVIETHFVALGCGSLSFNCARMCCAVGRVNSSVSSSLGSSFKSPWSPARQPVVSRPSAVRTASRIFSKTPGSSSWARVHRSYKNGRVPPERTSKSVTPMDHTSPAGR